MQHCKEDPTDWVPTPEDEECWGCKMPENECICEELEELWNDR